MSIYLGKNKVGVTKYENLDTELTEQEELLNSLEEDVNALSDKPSDRLQWKCDNMQTLYYEFYEYKGESLDSVLVGLDTSNVKNMNSMFYQNSGGSKLKSIPLLDTSNVTDMRNMFYRCTSLTEIPAFNTSKVKYMTYMLRECEALTQIPLFDTTNVTTMEGMFHSCEALTNLDLSNFNTSNVENMSYMFANCNALASLNVSNFDTSNVTTMYHMFNGCDALTTLDLSSFDTSNVTTMTSMFQGCINLTTILGELNLIKTVNTSSTFYNCRNLTNVTLKNIQRSLQIGSGTAYGHLLTNESLINTFKELWNLTGSTSHTLTLSTTSKENIANIYVKLVDVTDEMRAEDQYIDNKKPCVVCDSTDEGAMTLTEYAISKNWAIA